MNQNNTQINFNLDNLLHLSHHYASIFVGLLILSGTLGQTVCQNCLEDHPLLLFGSMFIVINSCHHQVFSFKSQSFFV